MLLLLFLLAVSTSNGYVIPGTQVPLQSDLNEANPGGMNEDVMEVEGSGLNRGGLYGTGFESEEELDKAIDELITSLRDKFAKSERRSYPMSNLTDIKTTVLTAMDNHKAPNGAKDFAVEVLDFMHSLYMTILAEERPTPDTIKDLLAEYYNGTGVRIHESFGTHEFVGSFVRSMIESMRSNKSHEEPTLSAANPKPEIS